MSDLSVPNTFVSGSSIVAADMNANFDAIETLINTTGVPLVQDATITPDKRSTAIQASATRAAGSSDLLGTSYSSYLTTGNLASTGRPVLVVASVTLNNAGSGAVRPVDMQVVMDGAAQGPVRTFDVITTDSAKMSFSLMVLVAAPSSGNRVFALQARCPSSAVAVAIREGSLIAIEL